MVSMVSMVPVVSMAPMVSMVLMVPVVSMAPMESPVIKKRQPGY